MPLANFYKTLELTSAATVGVPLLLCLYKFKTLSISMRVLFFYLVICVLTEYLNSIYTSGPALGIVQNTFTVMECGLLTWIYLKEFYSRLARQIIRIMMVSYIIVAVFLFAFIQPYTQTNDLLTTTEAWMMILLSLAFFYKTSIDLKIPKLTDNYVFWYNVAIISYFSTASIIFLFNRQLTNNLSVESFQRLYIPQLIMNMFYHGLLAMCIWKAPSK